MDEEEIFLNAIEILSVSDRAVFLTKACGDDVALRNRVESLIRSHEAAGTFLQPTVSPQDDGMVAAGLAAGDPTHVSYFGNYEILGLVARGGMGVVYRARQMNLNRIVALKMILTGQLATSNEIQRFQTEAEAAAWLDHPSIVPIYETGEYNKLHYFSMGYVEGESLAKKLQSGPLAPAEAAAMVATIADAVQYAHEKGVIHRDLKPANILIDHDGKPHITDFGLARRTESDHSLTGTGQVLGTPGYMAPEQARSAAKVSAAADIYALGAILYALLTGRPPFQSDNPIDTMLQTVNNDVVSPRLLNPRVAPDLEAIVLKALAKQPGQRFASAAEFREEVLRYLSGQPILTRRLYRWRKLIHTSIPASMTLADILCLTGSTALLVAMLVPIVHFGDREDYLIRCAPTSVPILIVGATVALISAAASCYRLTLVVSIWMACTVLFAFTEVSSYWAKYFDIGNWGIAGVACLTGGLLAVFVGAVSGYIRQQDRGDSPLRWRPRQISAAVATTILAVSPAVPLFQTDGTLYGESYHVSKSLLENSTAVSAAVLAFAGLAAFVVGRSFLSVLIAPAVLAAAVVGLNMKSTSVGETSVTTLGFLSVFGPCCVLALVAGLDVVAWQQNDGPADIRHRNSTPIAVILSRGMFLASAAIWAGLAIILWEFARAEMPGISLLSIPLLLAGAAILRAVLTDRSIGSFLTLTVQRLTILFICLNLLVGLSTIYTAMCFAAIQEIAGVALPMAAGLSYVAAAAIDCGRIRPQWIVWLLLVCVSLAIIFLVIFLVLGAFEDTTSVVVGFFLTGLAAVHIWLLWAECVLRGSAKCQSLL